jgi:DnaJ-class molecular chaperone
MVPPCTTDGHCCAQDAGGMMMTSEYYCAECERDWMRCPDCGGDGGPLFDPCDKCDGAGEVIRE